MKSTKLEARLQRLNRSRSATPGEIEPLVKTFYGVDRNEKNVTFGNNDKIIRVDMKKVVEIRHTTREIIGSFKRNDVRVRRRLESKYWKWANHRSGQILHAATNFILDVALRYGAALAFEDLTNIRKKICTKETTARARTFDSDWIRGHAGKQDGY